MVSLGDTPQRAKKPTNRSQMNNLITRLVLAVTFMLCGCTTVRYTQQQVMDRYKTSQDVKKQFGLPNEKMVSDTTEEWLYSYSGSKIEGSVETSTVPQFGEYKRYVIFSFNKQGNVVRWQSQHADLTEKKVSPVKTIALLAALGTVAIFTAYALTAAALANSL
jgi:hypothetical protein